MGILKKDFKFKVVKNFLSKEEIEIGRHYFLLSHKLNNNMEKRDFHQNNNGDSTFSHANGIFGDVMLMKKLERVEQETGLSLLPTYAFTRVYSYNAELVPHKDRPSCEVSVTTMWGSCGTPWPIFMDGNECHMEAGDAVIYLGCELEHYRKNFEGDWHCQTFLHYVDKNGPYVDWKFDKRTFFNNPEV